MFTPAVINEARFSIARSVEQDFGQTQGTDYNKQFGMPGGPSDPNLIGFPQINITNYATLGPVPQMPLRYWVTNYDTSDTLTWVKGDAPDQVRRGDPAQTISSGSTIPTPAGRTVSPEAGRPSPMPISCWG